MPSRTPAVWRLPESAAIGILALVATMVGYGAPPRDKRSPTGTTIRPPLAAHANCRPSGPAGGDRFRSIMSQKPFCTIFKNSHIFLDTGSD